MISRLTRRRFLQLSSLGGAAALGLAGVAIAAAADSGKVEQIEHHVPVPGLRPDFDGFRIGFLSDLHLSDCGGDGLIDEAITRLNDLQPDAVLLGGDYIWVSDWVSGSAVASLKAERWCPARGNSYQEDTELAMTLFSSAIRLLGRLEAPAGKYAVLGNHDRWILPDFCNRCLEEAGVRLLVNTEARIQRGGSFMRIYGADDYWTGLPEEPGFSQEDKESVKLVLAHNPDYISRLLRLTPIPLHMAFAGHTHGGQIRLPGLGAIMYNVQDSKLGDRLARDYRAPVYTSRGIGVVGIPVRINCPPEVAVITLVRA